MNFKALEAFERNGNKYNSQEEMLPFFFQVDVRQSLKSEIQNMIISRPEKRAEDNESILNAVVMKFTSLFCRAPEDTF